MRAKDTCPSCFQPVAPTDFLCPSCELILHPEQMETRPLSEGSVVRRMLEVPQRGMPTARPQKQVRAPVALGDEPMEGPTTRLDLGPELSGVPVVVATLTGLEAQLSELEAFVVSLIDGLSDASVLAAKVGLRELELRVVLRTLQGKNVIDFADEPLSDADLEMPAVLGTLESFEVDISTAPGLRTAEIRAIDLGAMDPPPRRDPFERAGARVVERKAGVPSPARGVPSLESEAPTNPMAQRPLPVTVPELKAAPPPPPPPSAPVVPPFPGDVKKAPPFSSSPSRAAAPQAPPPPPFSSSPSSSFAPPMLRQGAPTLTPSHGRPPAALTPSHGRAPAPAAPPPAPIPSTLAEPPPSSDARIVFSGNVNKRILDALKKVKRADAPATPSGPPKEEKQQTYADVLARDTLQVALRMEQNGRVEEAIRFLEKSIAQSPDAASLYNRLGIILMRERADFRRAEQLVRKAIELAPENTVYETNLRQVLSRAAVKQQR